jgi:hypothetical protein
MNCAFYTRERLKLFEKNFLNLKQFPKLIKLNNVSKNSHKIKLIFV